MSTTTMNTTCLTFEQLESYSLNKSELKERAQLYLHISNCELCACAVNGFAAISFTSAEVDAIHHQIDVRTNVSHANPLTFAQVLIACISVVSIFGFYQFAESFADKKQPLPKKETVLPILLPAVKTSGPVAQLPETTEPVLTKSEPVIHQEAFEKVNIPVESMTSIKPALILVSVKPSEVIAEHLSNSNVIYIYDLKITDYNSLYFKYVTKPFELKHTPAFKENKGSATDFMENGGERAVAADKTLKSALFYFNKGKYSDALAEFSQLLDYNPSDVNALFYSAVSYYHTGEYGRTIKNLEKVLVAPNTTFYPEAKWNLALSYLKAGDKFKAKQLFTEIASEKGFYSARASDKLKAL